MNIEIVEFYKNKNFNKKNKLFGSLHVKVKIESFEFDLRGILVYKEPKIYFFKIPHGWAYDEDKKQKVWYPTVNFENKDVQKDFITQIREKGQRFIEEKKDEQVLEKKPMIEKTKTQPAKGPKMKKPISAREWQDFSTYKPKKVVGVLKNKTYK